MLENEGGRELELLYGSATLLVSGLHVRKQSSYRAIFGDMPHKE